MRLLYLNLAVAALIGAAGPRPAVATDLPPDLKLVTVTGSGEVSALPDRARLSLSVDISRPEVKLARLESDRIMRDYLAKARTLGARDEDIQSTGFNVRPEYDNSSEPKSGPKLTGYRVTHRIVIMVRDLDRLGDFLQTATDCGINDVSDPELESSRADSLARDALARAATDAQAKARVLASALGAKLGAVHTIDASAGISGNPPRAFAMKATASGKQDLGINVGEILISATLTAAFDLLPAPEH